LKLTHDFIEETQLHVGSKCPGDRFVSMGRYVS